MRKLNTRTALLAGTCSLCAIVAWIFAGPFEGSEFGGGSVTGSLLTTYQVSAFLFAVAAFLTLIQPRVAAAIAVMAGILAVPLYAYVTAPGPFRMLTGGEYSVPSQSNFVWNYLAITGMGLLAIALFASLRVLVSSNSVNSVAPLHGAT